VHTERRRYYRGDLRALLIGRGFNCSADRIRSRAELIHRESQMAASQN
jgi:hypothetical protein